MKDPYFKFFPNDWMHDLVEHPLEVEGAWIRINCKLHWASNRGTLTKTWEQWAKILGVDEVTARRVITYIKDQNIGDVAIVSRSESTPCPELITVSCRRMLIDEKERLRWRDNKRTARMSTKSPAKCPQVVSEMSPMNMNMNNNNVIKEERKKKRRKKGHRGNGIETPEFLQWWSRYPRKLGKQDACEAYSIAVITETPDDLLRALDNYLLEIANNKTEEKYIKHPATFLRKDRWKDYLNWSPLPAPRDNKLKGIGEWLQGLEKETQK